MIPPELSRVLKDVMGLDASTIGPSSVIRGMRDRMKECGVESMEEYLRIVRTDTAERQELIERVVVPETSFFRDKESFNALVEWVRSVWLPSHPRQRLRVLSVPCSTGEEPYTIVMALLDGGLAPDRLEVHAADISRLSLDAARRGVYGRNSFRATDLSYRNRHFTALESNWQLKPEVQSAVRFHHANILEDDLPGSGAGFDIIFCRNLLIYFDTATQDRVVRRLSSWLHPDGLLFVGPAETGLMLQHDFTALKLPLSFAFQKGRPQLQEVKVHARGPSRVTSPVPVKKPVLPEKTKRKPAAASPSHSPKTVSLEAARQFADGGKLKEATAMCEAFQAAEGPSAEACFLLGMISDARGDRAEAVGFFRKAVYLDPKHPGALLSLALSCEREGDRSAAQRFRERAKRAGEVLKHV